MTGFLDPTDLSNTFAWGRVRPSVADTAALILSAVPASRRARWAA